MTDDRREPPNDRDESTDGIPVPRVTTRVLNGVRQEVASLIRMKQAPAARVRVGLRAAISIAVPFGVLTAFGAAHLGLQVGAGAFVALYFVNAVANERLRALPFIGVGLWVCAALGVLLTPWLWIWAAGLVILAIVVSVCVFGYRIGPPGSVFFVLVYGLAANATAVVDGERITAPAAFLTAFACGIVFSTLVSIAGYIAWWEHSSVLGSSPSSHRSVSIHGCSSCCSEYSSS